MKIKKIQALVLLGSFAGIGSMSAQTYLNGSFGAVALGTNGSAYSDTTLQLNPLNNTITHSQTGNFATDVPTFSDLTAYSLTLSGIGMTPTPESIANYFVFSSPDPNFGSSGTTPVNRFEFNLETIESLPGNQFSGTGTIIDTAPTGAYAPTAASFIVSFSSPPNAPLAQGVYSLTVLANGTQPVPEPTTLSLLTGGLLGAWALRRKIK